ARGRRRRLRRRQLSRCAAGPQDLVRSDGRQCRHQGPRAVARLGLGAMPMTVRVLISDPMDPKAAVIFAERGIDVDERTGLSPDELNAIIADYDGLAIRSATKVTAGLLEVAGRLKVIG